MVSPGNLSIPPLITTNHQNKYFDSGWELLKVNHQKIIQPQLNESNENVFCQFIHDGVNLKNKPK